MKKIILVNQTANYLFADIICAFANKHSQYEVEAWYGSFDYDMAKLPKSINLKQGPKYDRSSFGKRFRTWVRFYLWMRKQIKYIDKKNTHFFFVSNPPLFVFLPGIAQMSFDCLIYDLYPDVLGNMRKKGWINAVANHWENKNRQVLPSAKHIYTIGEGLKEAITEYLPLDAKDKVQIVPVWRQQSTVAQTTKRDFKSEWGISDKKVILYSGNIGLTHPLEYLIELAKRLQNYKDWCVVIVGNGAKKILLEQLANGLNNILFKEPVPFNELSALLSIATWGYVTLDSSATNTSVPSKTYNLLAAGVPILAMVNQQSDIAKLIDKYSVGLYFKENEIGNVIDKMTTIGTSEQKLLAENASVCSTHFTSALANVFADNYLIKDV